MILTQRLDQAADFNDLPGIQAGGRLIQDDHIRVANQRLRQANPLLIPLGKVFDQAFAHLANARQFAHIFHMRAHARVAHVLDRAYKPQIFFHRHIGIQWGHLRQIADVPLGLARFIQDIEAIQRHLPSGSGDIAGDDVHRGAFPRSIAPQKTEDLPPVDGEARVFYGECVAIALGKVFHFYHFAIHPFCHGAGRVSPSPSYPRGGRCGRIHI